MRAEAAAVHGDPCAGALGCGQGRPSNRRDSSLAFQRQSPQPRAVRIADRFVVRLTASNMPQTPYCSMSEDVAARLGVFGARRQRVSSRLDDMEGDAALRE